MSKTVQYNVKVILYDEKVIDVVENIIASSEQAAGEEALKMVRANLTAQMETPSETNVRLIRTEYTTIEHKLDELGEFLYDDYGSTVETIGKKNVVKLEKEYTKLKKRFGELGEQLNDCMLNYYELRY